MAFLKLEKKLFGTIGFGNKIGQVGIWESSARVAGALLPF